MPSGSRALGLRGGWVTGLPVCRARGLSASRPQRDGGLSACRPLSDRGLSRCRARRKGELAGYRARGQGRLRGQVMPAGSRALRLRVSWAVSLPASA